MKKAALFAILLTIGFSACKSSFEQIRVSGDPELILEKAREYYEEKEYQKAQTLFELAIGAFRGKPELEEIYFKYADTYYQQERYLLASFYFENFSNTFSTSPLRKTADFMVADSYFQLSPSYRLDQTNTEKAIDAFQLFVNTYPDDEKVDQCNAMIDLLREKLERKTYAAAKLYFDLRQYQASTRSFENLLKDFPETQNGEQVRYMIVKSSFLLADNSILGKRAERYQETLEYAENYLKKYPNSENRKEVQNILDTSKNNYKIYSDDRYQIEGSGS